MVEMETSHGYGLDRRGEEAMLVEEVKRREKNRIDDAGMKKTNAPISKTPLGKVPSNHTGGGGGGEGEGQAQSQKINETTKTNISSKKTNSTNKKKNSNRPLKRVSSYRGVAEHRLTGR